MNQYKNITGSMPDSLAFIDAIDEREGLGRGHSRRVSLLATRLVQEVNATELMAAEVGLAGLLHDVGKASIPANILTKPDRLTCDERAIVQQHPRLGYEMLRDVPGLESILPGVLHHHERFDGGGYPSGLEGSDIPLMARMLCIADAFDAMTSPRCYRQPASCDDALAELKAEADKQFDPSLVQAFLNIDLADYVQNVESLWLHTKKRAA